MNCRNYENNQLCLEALKAFTADMERRNTYAVCAQRYVDEFRSSPR